MRVVLMVAVAAGIAVLAWLYRFNDPLGSYAGLTDDHFFYVIRGWQILFGELPTRDFVDPGEPLTFLVAAGAQWFGRRGTLSEMVLCVTALSLGSALTFLLAAKVARSILIGIGAATLQVAQMTRLYSYPKILVYVMAIPLLWAFATKPSRGRRFALALIAAVAFLFRYDHGVFVALSVVILLALMVDVRPATRLRHAVMYGGTVVALLIPYLVYLQTNGGIVFQAQTAYSWLARERARAPLVWPAFTRDVGVSEASDRPMAYLAQWTLQNTEAAMFYLWFFLPLVCLAMLWRAPQGFRPDWPHARVKVAVVAALAIMLNVGFLRGNLSARFGDVSVPQAILAAWFIGACATIALRGQWDGQARVRTTTRILVLTLAMMVITTIAIMIVLNHRDRDVLLSPNETRAVIQKFKFTWPLERWASPLPTGPLRVAQYLYACTKPDDHLFVTPYLPQVIGLADRPFAGGHGDLRPYFYDTVAQQRLTMARLDHQDVPIVIMPPPDEYSTFQQSFPILDAYLQRRFRPAGTLDLGDGSTLQLFVDRTRQETGRYPPFDWPCFQ